MRYFLTLMLLFPLVCFSQIDSSYIRPFKQKISVQVYMYKNFLAIEENLDKNNDLEYKPNNPVTLGLGLSVRNSVLSFSYGYGFDFMKEKSKGKTKSMDFQYHYYARKFILDAYVQRYKGFYVSDDKDNLISIQPNLKAELYGLSGQYILNNKKFSGKAAFNQTEKQLKSAGSFLVGAQVYVTRVKPDSSFLSKNNFDLRNFQFGVSGGYAHIWVIKQNWSIALSATAGINMGNEKFSNFGKSKIEVYPSFSPRFIAAYNCESWAISAGAVFNALYPFYKNNISIFSGYMGISFSKRLDLSIPILDKLKL